MNKVKGYINILITISVILVVLGLILPTPVRGNLYDLIFAIYSNGFFIGSLIGIYFLYIFIVIPVRTIKSIYQSGGINDEAFLKMNMAVTYEKGQISQLHALQLKKRKSRSKGRKSRSKRRRSRSKRRSRR